MSEVKVIVSKRALPLTSGRQPKAAAIRLCLGIFLDNPEPELKSRVLLPGYLLLLLLILLLLLLSSLVCESCREALSTQMGKWYLNNMYIGILRLGGIICNLSR